MDEYEEYGEEAPNSPEPSSSDGEDTTTVSGHTIVYKTNHMGHMTYALKWLHNHHSEVEEMIKALKNGTEPGQKNYYKFEASGYTFKLHKKNSEGEYKLEWKQA